MNSALTEFLKGRTSIAQSQENIDPHDPVLVACVEPPLKPSFFKDHGLGFNPYFWAIQTPEYDFVREKLEKNSSMKEVYMNMSYVLDKDFNILIVKPLTNKLQVIISLIFLYML